MKVNEIIEKCNELLEDETLYLETIVLTRDEVKTLVDEIERLNNVLDEIDLMFYRMRFVGFNSTKNEICFLNTIINDVRKMCQNKKLLEENK